MVDRRALALINGGIAEFPTGDRVAVLSPDPSYRTLIDSTASHNAAKVAATHFLSHGQATTPTGTGGQTPPNMLYIDSADYPTVGALTAKLRVRAVLAVNDVAPTGNYTFGLHPVTRPATSGPANQNIFTIGAAVAGSTVLSTAPAADALINLVGSDFAVPAAGFYVLGLVTTATVATSSNVIMSAALQMRYS